MKTINTFRESLVHQQEKSKKENLDTRRSIPPPHTKEKTKIQNQDIKSYRRQREIHNERHTQTKTE